eukprot:TRINITY_DN27649_c0_g1_i1.p1 TRINITY_DN27649_c0_g1~~TRINITY_DN27649_c0_g1_i1.p1  ORF type:complete len:130 (+),score=7.09 TRINITY_DN27649_c0_g1_i1:66-455(+)
MVGTADARASADTPPAGLRLYEHELNFCTPLIGRPVVKTHRTGQDAVRIPLSTNLPDVDANPWTTYSMPTMAPRAGAVAMLPPLKTMLAHQANMTTRYQAAKLRELGQSGVARRAQLRREFRASKQQAR